MDLYIEITAARGFYRIPTGYSIVVQSKVNGQVGWAFWLSVPLVKETCGLDLHIFAAS
jgi:hypothetical protein